MGLGEFVRWGWTLNKKKKTFWCVINRLDIGLQLSKVVISFEMYTVNMSESVFCGPAEKNGTFM